jgi:hypothetical protein
MHLSDFASPAVANILGLLALAVGSWIGHRIASPNDHHRAEILAHIAEGAAALVVSLNPGAAWGDLLVSTVNAIASAAGLPTRSRDAIQRAAASALAKLGKTPTE